MSDDTIHRHPATADERAQNRRVLANLDAENARLERILRGRVSADMTRHYRRLRPQIADDAAFKAAVLAAAATETEANRATTDALLELEIQRALADLLRESLGETPEEIPQ